MNHRCRLLGILYLHLNRISPHGLASYAYQIWKNAIDADPTLQKAIPELPSVVYSTKAFEPQDGRPNGVLVYLRDATVAERLLPRIRVIDAAHPLFGQPLAVSASGLGRRIGWIQVILPDGRHRWVPQKATDLNVSACEARPNRDLPLVSVRTLIPLAEYVRARLSASGERFDETSGHTADPAVRAGIAGSTADPGAEIVADDDTDNTTTASEAGGTATPVNADRSRRRRFDRGALR